MLYSFHINRLDLPPNDLVSNAHNIGINKEDECSGFRRRRDLLNGHATAQRQHQMQHGAALDFVVGGGFVVVPAHQQQRGRGLE